ncbi:hypothetical protein HDA40_001351 [Hamadaea flava]|uniref:Uncharacterized protein n=1 Tax=Hamadaea flava TaxID=1742688 RepID=A0ABV8LPU3_9ACTN|nr:hypothetical protein [Hamadaea flava]MCP2322844.1 hypothetical protein [Hamadaea flava]
MKTISKWGDRLLSRALGTGTAGACVPEHGNSCSYWKSDGHCSSGVFFQTYCSGGTISCTGSCSGASCVSKKRGAC